MKKHYAVLNLDNVVEAVITSEEEIAEERFIEIPCHDVYLPGCYYDGTRFVEPARERQGHSDILDEM